MSMEHKGYAFDWQAFERELYPAIIQALETGDSQEIIAFIERNLDQLSDPYEGAPLNDRWQMMLSNRDVHEYGDYALTKFYDPSQAMGVGEAWMGLSERLPARAARALLGEALGPEGNRFDPGRMGSYFQCPEQVPASLEALANVSEVEGAAFRELLEYCAERGLGVYVTF